MTSTLDLRSFLRLLTRSPLAALTELATAHDNAAADHSRFSFYQGWPRHAAALLAADAAVAAAVAAGAVPAWAADLVWPLWPLVRALSLSLSIGSAAPLHALQQQRREGREGCDGGGDADQARGLVDLRIDANATPTHAAHTRQH